MSLLLLKEHRVHFNHPLTHTHTHTHPDASDCALVAHKLETKRFVHTKQLLLTRFRQLMCFIPISSKTRFCHCLLSKKINDILKL